MIKQLARKLLVASFCVKYGKGFKMSRIGKNPIHLPENVTFEQDNDFIVVKGPKGVVKKTNNDLVKINVESNTIKISPLNQSRLSQALWGTYRSIVNNMVEGVTKGFEKNLEINGVGFRASIKGNSLNLNLGFSHEINYLIPDSIKIEVNDSTKLKVSGADKELVGQVTAEIKEYFPMEPYKGKGVYVMGEFKRRKEGKKTA